MKTMEQMLRDIYRSLSLEVTELQEEDQNSKYQGAIFKLNHMSVRFRVAHVTPTKIGQFVAFWEKNEMGKNHAYHFDQAPDLLVITVYDPNNKIGQFVFPKSVLREKGLLQSDLGPGKMAMRVYPSWDVPTNKQAIYSQKWQLEYFFTKDDLDKGLTLYKI